MAVLPISHRHYALPYTLVNGEDTTTYRSSNRRPTVVRHGSHSFEFTLQLIPFNVVNAKSFIENLSTFLEMNAVFDIPINNRITNTLSGNWRISGGHRVGASSISVNPAVGAPQVGQYLRFGTKSKVYRVRAYNRGTITLTKPLRQSLRDRDALIYSAVDGLGDRFDGVLGEFVNKDFGYTNPKIDQGAAWFGPFLLEEAII